MAKGYIDLAALRDRVRRLATEAAHDEGMERVSVEVQLAGGLAPRIVIVIDAGANLRVNPHGKETDN